MPKRYSTTSRALEIIHAQKFGANVCLTANPIIRWGGDEGLRWVELTHSSARARRSGDGANATDFSVSSGTLELMGGFVWPVYSFSLDGTDHAAATSKGLSLGAPEFRHVPHSSQFLAPEERRSRVPMERPFRTQLARSDRARGTSFPRRGAWIVMRATFSYGTTLNTVPQPSKHVVSPPFSVVP
jgi:hypothetical protein